MIIFGQPVIGQPICDCKMMLENFSEIRVESPVDKIIKQIRSHITSGQIKPGEKLPPERKLAERLGVGRSQVREAIQKLEFYGILRTQPQSGTYVAGIGIPALEGLMTDLLMLENNDFRSLVETRVLLETNSAVFAAERRTGDDIINIQKALKAYEEKVEKGQQAVEEDLMFHLKIAEASKNSVLKSLMLVITPDIIKSFNTLEICKNGRPLIALEEHKEIVQHIIDKESDLARQAMLSHLSDVVDYSNNLLK